MLGIVFIFLLTVNEAKAVVDGFYTYTTKVRKLLSSFQINFLKRLIWKESDLKYFTEHTTNTSTTVFFDSWNRTRNNFAFFF